MSRIFLYNPNNCSVQYIVNGGRTPLVQPTERDHTPNFISVRLQKHIQTGTFSRGPNDFIVSFQDADREDQNKHHDNYTIEITHTRSLLDDIIIYSFRKMLLVMDTRGFPISRKLLLINRTHE